MCRDGYEGDGHACSPVNLCLEKNRGGCDRNVRADLGLLPLPDMFPFLSLLTEMHQEQNAVKNQQQKNKFPGPTSATSAFTSTPSSLLFLRHIFSNSFDVYKLKRLPHGVHLLYIRLVDCSGSWAVAAVCLHLSSTFPRRCPLCAGGVCVRRSRKCLVCVRRRMER